MQIHTSLGKATPLLRPSRFSKLWHIAIAWLVSSASLFGEIMPFGAALFGARYTAALPKAAGLVALLATLFPHFLPAATIKYALAISLFHFIVSRKGIGTTPLSRGLLMGGCVFLAGLFMLLGGQMLIYDCFLLVFEAIVTLCAVCLFAAAEAAFSKKDGLSSAADIMAVSALVGVGILGISCFFTLYGLSLTVPLAVLAVLLLTHENGMVAGAVSGITLGLLVTLESGNPVLGAFAVAGMAAGYFSRFGRAGAALAFISANALVTFYSGGEVELVLTLPEVIAPSLIYLALPPALLGRLWQEAGPEKFCQSRLQTLLAQELREKSEAFAFLSGTFTDISQRGICNEGAASGTFFEKTARCACHGCRRLSLCWKQEFHRTYASFFVLLEICEREGKITADDIPTALEEKCIQTEVLLEAVNQTYALYKVDKLWESRMQEARALVARQLSAVSHIFSVMEKRTRTGFTESRVEEDILRNHLCSKNILVRDVAVLRRRSGMLSVTLSAEAEPSVVQSTVSEALATPMEITTAQKGYFRLVPAQKVSLQFWGETTPREGSDKSGDSFETLFLDSGIYLVALSDGMGSGERAGQDSRAAVSMLRALFAAGFDTETAVGLVNSTLVLKSAEESFATLDILLLNARNLTGEFIKAGSAASFILRGDTVHTFSAPSMPCGMLPSPEAARIAASFAPGDIIVMVSDGMQDPACRAENGAWLATAIREFPETEPRALARHLLSLAREKSGGRVRDDLTVLCARITEKGGFVA